MTRLGRNRARLTGSALAILGLVLLANPLWIRAVTVYPGTGWAFLPLFHATFTTIGVVILVVGVLTLRTVKPPSTPTSVLLLAGGIVVFVPLYGMVAELIIGTHGTSLAGYEFKRAFVASLVVALFIFGWGIGNGRKRVLGLALALPVVPLLLVGIEWYSGALLGPVLDFYFLLTGGPLLGISYLGSVLLVGTFLFGLWVGRRWPDLVFGGDTSRTPRPRDG